MEKSPQPDASDAPPPSLLAHLEQAFGWSTARAVDALGAYLMSTAAGSALSNALASSNRDQRAA